MNADILAGGRSLWLGFALVLSMAACGDEPEDEDDGDSNASETEPVSDTQDPTDDPTDDPTGPEDPTDDPSESSGGSSTCDGDWYLGSVPFTGDAFIEACDANPPTICITGNYIVFGDGECYCLPECAAAGLSEGDACTDDGSITCTRIENDDGESSGVFCVPPAWRLCG